MSLECEIRTTSLRSHSCYIHLCLVLIPSRFSRAAITILPSSSDICRGFEITCIDVCTGLLSKGSGNCVIQIRVPEFSFTRMGAPEVAAVGAQDNAATAVVPQMSYAEFQRWKQQKDGEAEVRAAEAARKRVEDIGAGRVPMNGRELYEHEPWVFDDARFDT